MGASVIGALLCIGRRASASSLAPFAVLPASFEAADVGDRHSVLQAPSHNSSGMNHLQIGLRAQVLARRVPLRERS